MDKILNLTLAYPDFQLNQVIDPDQVDLNNAQITSKVNEISSKINALVSGTTGASHITISPLTQFSDKSTVQDTIKAIVDTLVNMGGASFIGANFQDGKITIQDFLDNINTIVTNNVDGLVKLTDRMVTQENMNEVQKGKLDTIETNISTNANGINAVKTRVENIETANQTTNNKVTAIESKNTYQDQQIATLNSTVTSHGTRVTTLENKAGTTASEMATVKQDIARINTTNTNQEVVEARTGFANLKEKLDYSEISIGTNLNEKSKINFVVTDSNATAFWEDKLAIASLDEHNADPTAHGGNITAHNTSATAHADIRQLIASKASTWADIQNKPTLFPPTVHTHSKSQISDFNHSHNKTDIVDFNHTHLVTDITNFNHTHPKADAGLGNVDNVKQMPIAGGTFIGNVTMASGTTLSGHVVIPTGKPANAVKGTIWLE